MNEIVKYIAEGLGEFAVLIAEDTVWLTQAQMTTLFQRDKSVISRHISNVFKENELNKNSTVANFATVQMEGGREVARDVEYYNLDVIISVGYRVKSLQGTQFRIWATQVLKNYLLKGYAIRRPVTKAELDEAVARLEQQIKDVDTGTYVQFEGIYQALIELASKKELEDKQPRRRIGFQ